ncbi:cell division protein FtsZ [Filobacillus milosensis]|uniref:Cell division protein FtsZ n=1 Tax=Filobacillus milosensis TaxID=94137 RepID=A0A4Y8IH61_9BACI|nr:cell division protein FtsZ [Filobacillus milosensis]TFB14641.1 cell division protein FtsZ [Filobacillus milosensis]
METPVKIYHVDQGEWQKNKLVMENPEQENLYFFRFIGGNPSETDELIQQLRVLKGQKTLLIGIFRFPFRFEGKRRAQTATEQYLRMKEFCDAVIYFHSDDLMDLIDHKTSIRDAQNTFNAVEEETIRSLKELIEHTGDMNIDFHDIESFIHKNKGPFFIHTVENDSFDIPLKYLISTPYLPKDFTDGDQLIINIGYTRDVNMETFRQINLRLHDLFSKAELFKIGSYFIDEPGERFKITLIVNGIADPIEPPENYRKISKYNEMVGRCKRIIEKGKRRYKLMKS